MTTHEQFTATTALAAGEPAGLLSGWIRSMGLRLVTWADTCADHWAAAAIYERLSALSDAELARRGLSRTTLAHHLRTAWTAVPP